MRGPVDERRYARHMEPGNLEPRVTALENQVRDLAGRVQASEQDAAAARVLAGAADRDVCALSGELRDFRAEHCCELRCCPRFHSWGLQCASRRLRRPPQAC